MTSEFGKMLKCLTTRTYRSLQEDNYTPVPVGTKPSHKEEEKPTNRRKSHSEPPSTLGSPQKNGVGPVVGVGVNGGGGSGGGSSGGGGSSSSSSGGSGGGGGGFHSFRSALGLRLKNAATRCLEKKSEPDQQSAAGCHACRDATGLHRYSRFPANTSNPCCCCGRNRFSTGQSLPSRPLPSGDGSPHVHPTALTRTFAHPHRGLLVHPISSPSSNNPPKSSGKSSGGLSVPKCLRRYRVGGRSEAAKRLRERSKSDNSLQRFSVNPTGKQDHLLQRLFKNGSEDQIFLPVVTGRGAAAALGFGDIGDGSVTEQQLSESEIAASKKRFARRSRSLERASNFRVYPAGDVSAALCNVSAASRTTASGISPGSGGGVAGSSGWRSLERNHKFRIRGGGCGTDEEEVLRRAVAALPARAPSLPHHAFPHCDACPLAVTNGDPHHLVAAASAAACAGSVLVCRVGGGGRWEGTTMPRYVGVSGSGAGGGGSSGGGGFLNKPARGWLHSDRTIAKEGVCYAVRYIGCLQVNTSMKMLDFDTRSQIAKECINRVCEEAGLKTADKKRKVDRKIQRIIGDKPIMDNAGSNVNLLITSTCLKLTLLDSGKVIADHQMPSISFASGGDPDTLDFIAYVAKDTKHGRACFVLECGGGLAQDVITTVGQAFELRFKEYLKSTPKVMCISGKSDSIGNAIGGEPSTLPMSMANRAAGGTSPGGVTSWEASSYDPDYYNDLPGKVPPDIGPPPVPPLPHYHGSGGAGPSARPAETPNQPPAPPPLPTDTRVNASGGHVNRGGQEMSGSTNNLIDFHCEVEGIAPPPPAPEHDYENDLVVGWGWTPANAASRTGRAEPGNPVRDVFDMQPFATSLTLATQGAVSTTGRNTAPLNPASQKAQLHGEAWFHGPISRKEAEALLLKDGDFLVRESQGSPGQYVLTGMQSGIKKHLLLVDPEGVVRTKDRMFESVSHLINYHCENELPIISAESALVLRHPVHRPR